jgi:hypothetical protein
MFNYIFYPVVFLNIRFDMLKVKINLVDFQQLLLYFQVVLCVKNQYFACIHKVWCKFQLQHNNTGLYKGLPPA